MQQHWYKQVISRRWALVLGAAILVVVALGFFSQRPVSVQVAYPESDVSISVFGLGTVEARVISEVGFEVSAALVEINTDHGDQVKKNDVLARLHSGEQQAQVGKAQAGVFNAEAAMNMTEAIVNKARAVLRQRQQTNNRQQRLLAQNTVSAEVAEDAQLQQDVATAELAVALSEVDVGKAQLADAKAQLDYEEVLLDHHELRAPYDATVVKRHHELGSVLNAGESLFTLVDTGTVWALAYVDESRAGDIRVGQSAEVRFRSLPRTLFPGHVSRIDIESDRVNEERRVYVSCDQCPKSFHLGEQAEVFIETGDLTEAVLIPETAVAGFDGSRGTIWVVDDQHLRLLSVKFGSKTLDGRLEIVAGLLDDALAVTVLHDRLREGRRAKAITKATP